MKRRATVRGRAEADLREASKWYNSQRSGLGDELLDMAEEAIRSLAEDSDRFPIYYGEYRRILLERFPYKFFFKIKGDQVVIYRFHHTKRDHRRLLWP